MTDYARPDSLPKALQLLSRGGWRVLAGGTDLYPGAGSRLDGDVLDLGGLDELSGIRAGQAQGQGLRIGAATSWTAIAEADLPPAARALQQAALQVGGRQVQNAGTIGGNLCNASPAADGVPPLLALDAMVEVASPAGTRTLALDRFLLGPRRTALGPDEVLTAILIPQAGLSGQSAFVKLGTRAHLVISIAMVAARLELAGDRITHAAVAVGACSPVAQRLPAVEAALVGPRHGAADRIPVEAVAAALAPIDAVRAAAAYRREAAAELVRRAVNEALA